MSLGNSSITTKNKRRNNDIIPLVRNAAYIEAFSEGGKDHIWEPYGDELAIFYARYSSQPNTPPTLLNHSHLNALGLDMKTLRACAVENIYELLNRCSATGIKLDESADGRLLQFHGKHSPSLILADEIWQSRFDFRGSPVIAMPTRELLLVTGSNDVKNLVFLRSAIDSYQGESPVSREIFTLVEGRFIIFKQR